MINKLTIRFFACLTAIFFLLSGCIEKTPENSCGTIKIQRLDRAIAEGIVPDSLADACELTLSYLSTIRDKDVTLEDLSNSRTVEMFQPAIESRLGSLDSVEISLQKAFARMKKIFPDEPNPHIYGIILPTSTVLIMSDSTVLVGLNHYLGADFKGYDGFPDYKRKDKEKKYIPQDIIDGWINLRKGYVESENPTLLQEMLYRGAVLYVSGQLLEESPLYEIMKHSPEEMKWLEENEGNIYRKMIEDKMLFSSDPLLADKLLRNSPGTFVINPDCPSGAGVFTGYRIVDSFMKNNPETPLSFLLTPEFYNGAETLQKAGYQPK